MRCQKERPAGSFLLQRPGDRIDHLDLARARRRRLHARRRRACRTRRHRGEQRPSDAGHRGVGKHRVLRARAAPDRVLSRCACVDEHDDHRHSQRVQRHGRRHGLDADASEGTATTTSAASGEVDFRDNYQLVLLKPSLANFLPVGYGFNSSWAYQFIPTTNARLTIDYDVDAGVLFGPSSAAGTSASTRGSTSARRRS